MSLIDMLSQTMQGGGIDQISERVGLDKNQVSTVVAGAMPMLIGALKRNADKPGGAEALAGALDRDHDGSVIDDLAGFLGKGGEEKAGAGILGHVFGSRQTSVESALGGMAGMDKGQVGQILMMLAPVVMGALGKTKREKGLDIGSLTDLLRGEDESAKKAAPETESLLGSLLDSDGDGQVVDDIAKIGGSLLSSFFGKR
jgi:hypothetical protein